MVAVATAVALEFGEVVEVVTTGVDGNPHASRVWVVDADGTSWLEANNSESPWYQRALAQPQVTVRRGTETQRYRARPVLTPGARDQLRRRMREKYGIADWWVGLLFGQPDSVAIRLDSTTEPG